MTDDNFVIEPIGIVRSELVNRADAPMQGYQGGYQGGYDAWLELNPEVASGLKGIQVGDELMLLTWLHLSDRTVLQVQRHGDTALRGVFSTRSPNRPNPIGLHRVSVLQIDGLRVKVTPLEAIDGTPIVDMKPVLHPPVDER